eukprot:9472676-Pyramimonas_sp.AAC.1
MGSRGNSRGASALSSGRLGPFRKPCRATLGPSWVVLDRLQTMPMPYYDVLSHALSCWACLWQSSHHFGTGSGRRGSHFDLPSGAHSLGL